MGFPAKFSMNRCLTLVTACCFVIAVPAVWAQRVVTEDSPTPEGAFILDAAKGGLAEIKMGKLAAEKAADPKVKEFGNKMVEDHQKVNDELRQVANDRKVKWPDDLTDEQVATFKKLSQLSGPDFDRQYVQAMVEDHQKDVDEFRQEEQRAQDPELKGFVSRTLPVLQHHLQMAQDLQRQEPKGSGESGSGESGYQPRFFKVSCVSEGRSMLTRH
jgi:putative membrane protein